MIVDCPSCGTGFRLDESALGEAGRRLRCSVCGHVWFQPAPEAAASATAPQADAGEAIAHRNGEEHRGETAPPEAPAPAAPPAPPAAPPAPGPARQGSGGWGFMLFLLLVIGGIALAVLLSRVLPPFWA